MRRVRYCAWAGRRLCGAIGGATITIDEFQDPAKAEWTFACTKGGTRAYPYGNVYSATACNGADFDAGAPLAVGTLKTCEGGYAGLFDMSGNAHEWLATCDVPVDGVQDTAPCAIANSSWEQPIGDMACNQIDTGSLRSDTSEDLGVRCCSDPRP